MSTRAPGGQIYRFADCELDTRLHELRCGGVVRHIEPQVFDVLAFLLARNDRLVTKDELLDGVWGHRFVAPTTLNSRIKSARQAVGDDGRAQRVIQTVHGRGFRVLAAVEERAAGAPRPGAAAETSPAGQRIQFCTAADGVRIAYATSGSGPPLVKPANWLTNLERDWDSPVWRHWLQGLSRGRTLVRYDQRGNGLSDRDVADVSFEAWVRDLETVVAAAGLQRFPLLALSQGCATAVTYAVRHPEQVSRLILYGGYTEGHFRRARTPAARAEAELLIRNLPMGWGRDNPAFRQFFAGLFLPEGTPEQHRWFVELQRVTTAPEMAVRLRTTAADIDITKIAPLVTAPTLVLHATGDAVVPFNQGRQLAALVPGARFIPLESRNHILMADEPAWQRFLQEVTRFLDEPS